MTKYLIDNWKQAYKMLSIWVAIACITFAEALSQAQQLTILGWFGMGREDALGFAGGLFIVARLIRQFGPREALPQPVTPPQA